MALDLVPLGAPPAGSPCQARTLTELFHEMVDLHPGRPALDTPEQTLTYSELRAAAAGLAARLAAGGVGRGDRIGIRIPGGAGELYVAILGVLMAGAAYVPVDADDPPHRAESVWDQAAVAAVVGPGLELDVRSPGAGVPGPPEPDDDAWIIFTSGSTGAPKGVAVTHRNALAFVRAEGRLWTVDPTDRVLAGLSVAFDASCEEQWLAWANGAALVPAPRRLVRAGGELGPWLAERGISVVSTVPTLAAMWDDDALRGVRLLICGGEALGDELAWRLARDREVWNTYGPTEATVVSTAVRVVPGEPVTIGWPLDGWEVAVVDAAGRPVPLGEPGELVVGGVGLARYLDEQLDAARYAPNAALGWPRAYRTGDVVRETPSGLAFVGRRDDQVKLGGRRIELGEVEAHARSAPGVRAAAAVVRRSEGGNPILAVYVAGAHADAAAVRGHLATRLPGGVVPLVLVLDELPVRTSGKVDRDALPWPPPGAGDAASPAAGLTGTAAWLAECWARQLGPLAFDAESDFFELGGSSLAVAKLVSDLRERFPAVAVADVYEHRRLGALAGRLDAVGEVTLSRGVVRRRPSRRWGIAQVAGVLVLLAATAPAWIAGILALDDLAHAGPRLAWPWLIAGYLVLMSPMARAATAAAARRVLLRGVRPGRYPRHGSVALRLWFVDRLGEALRLGRLGGTPWAGRAARLMGHDVAPTARLATLPPPASLVRIEDDATVEADVDLHGWWVEGGEVVLGAPRVGRGARIGTRTVLMPDADVGAGAEVEPGSVVGEAVPAGERWAGSPARRVGDLDTAWPDAPPAPERGRPLMLALFAAGTLLVGIVSLVAALPGLLLLDALVGPAHSVPGELAAFAAAAPALAVAFVVTEAVVNALAFRAVARLIRPGWHSDQGLVAWALWMSQQIQDVSLTVLFPLYSTVFTRPWLRLHGVRIGRRTEVATVGGLTPLVELGETSMVADHPMFASARAHRGWLHVRPIAIGDHSFIGNGALITGGTSIGDGCLVGIETNAPEQVPHGTSWFGAPALELPRVPDATDPARTTDPPRRLVLARGAVELVRILLPTTISLILGLLVLLAMAAAGSAAGLLGMVAAAPVALAAAGAGAVLATVVVKWVVIGRYRPGEHPLWSSLVWRDEIVNSCQELLAEGWLLNRAQGTPLIGAYLRAMGARVGRDVWCDTLAITEFDMVSLGDGCAVNRGACLETHLFHDRVLRIGPATMEAGATLGPVSAVLPDTRMGEACVVGGRSVVLRGEVLPAGSRWHGAPVVAAWA